MSEYFNTNGFQEDNGTGEPYQPSAYTYIPTDPIEPDSIKKPEKKKKKKGGIGKKIGLFLLCGVIVGGAGAGTFIGVMKASGYEDMLQNAVSTANQSSQTSDSAGRDDQYFVLIRLQLRREQHSGRCGGSGNAFYRCHYQYADLSEQ